MPEESGLVTHPTVSKSNNGAKIDRNSAQLPCRGVV